MMHTTTNLNSTPTTKVANQDTACYHLRAVYHPHTSTQPFSKGEIVELEISLWPGGMVFDAGERLSLEIKGRHPIMPEFAGLEEKMVNYNVGRHRVHTGGQWPSQVLVSLKRGGDV